MRLALVLAACWCLLLPASAGAACGGVHRVSPERPKGAPRAPLAIGDSSMLLALPDLRRRGFAANAHGCRQFPEALRLLRSLRSEHRLPGLVVIALGADGVVTRDHIRATLRILGTQRRLVLVTPLELGGGQGSDARLVRRADRLYPGRVNVLDWVRHSRGHPDWFQPDGLHLTFAGATAFARFLVRARPLAQRTPTAFGSVRFDKPGASTRVAATLRLTPPSRWSVSTEPRRAAAGAPGFAVRRRGACAARITLTATGRRELAPRGVSAGLAALVPAGAALLGSATAGDARALTWRTPGGGAGGGWSIALGDPFPDDGNRSERAYLDVTAVLRPVPRTRPGCARRSLLALLARLRRLAV